MEQSQIHDNRDEHRFELELGGGDPAIAEYRLEPGKIVFIHTFVPPDHRGEGIASRLIEQALQWAREHKRKVVPRCPFVAAYIKAHADVQDLVAS